MKKWFSFLLAAAPAFAFFGGMPTTLSADAIVTGSVAVAPDGQSSLTKGRALLRQAVRTAGREFGSGDVRARAEAVPLYRAAIPHLMQAAIDNPNDPTIVGSLSTAFAGAGSRKGQISTLELGVQKFPQDGSLLLMLGSAYLADGNWNGVKLVLSALDAVDPARATALRAMAKSRL